MERVKMFMSGVVTLALLCFFSAPTVQAQVFDNTTHQLKLSGSFAGVDDVNSSRIERGGGSETVLVVLKNPAVNIRGGFDYDINLILNETTCGQQTIGTLSTYTGEDAAFGDLAIPNFPDPGQTLVGQFFAKVKPKIGKTSFKSASGWFVIEAGVAIDPIAITKKANLKAKEKTPQKLGLQCIP